ncbi:Serine dehydrogenase proteinase [compost metagenome]
MIKKVPRPSTISSLVLESDASDTHKESGPSSHAEKIMRAKAALAEFEGDLFIHSGGISSGQEENLARILHNTENRPKKATLWLTTPGGDPDTAYQIARLLQKKYEHFSVFINGWCKSSGTLICLGAKELIMDDLGQLGPLDIQILNKEEFGERLSGLNPIEALKSISIQSLELLRQQFLSFRFGGGLSTKQALEVATNLTGQLMSPITAQLDIMKYGEFTRSMRIALEYGNRLAKGCGGNNLKPDAINLLTTGYPSHGFVIDRDEASDTLFNKVSKPSDELVTIAESLQSVVDSYFAGANNSVLMIDLRHALGVPAVTPDKEESSEPEPQIPGTVNAQEPSTKTIVKKTTTKRNKRPAKEKVEPENRPEVGNETHEPATAGAVDEQAQA